MNSFKFQDSLDKDEEKRMKNNTNKKNIKVEATFIIWGCTTGIMAICIPLVSASDIGDILPLAVIIGASASTIAVWTSDRQESFKDFNNSQQIEQRIRNLETICSSEDFDLNNKSNKTFDS